MRIGLSAGAATVDRMVEQVAEAETDGFTTMWFAGATGGDPLIAIALAGRATSSIELGTSVVQTYPRHPVSMAQAAVAVDQAIGGERFTLGIGVSHRPVIEDMYGLSYERSGQHMREYLDVLMPALRGEKVDVDGDFYRVRTQGGAPREHPVPVLIAALAPLMLRAAGGQAQGTITWMANARAVGDHIAPLITKAAESGGQPAPRIVVGLPVAVTDNEEEGRQAAATQFAGYGTLPNYRRVLDAGGADGPADAAIVGNEEKVASELRALVDAGATDVWAAIFAAGPDRKASRARTRSLLKSLL